MLGVAAQARYAQQVAPMVGARKGGAGTPSMKDVFEAALRAEREGERAALVTVVATGDQKIVSIAIKKEAVDPDDVEMLQDLVLAAVNDALDKSRALQEERMGGLTGGMGLPGLGF